MIYVNISCMHACSAQTWCTAVSVRVAMQTKAFRLCRYVYVETTANCGNFSDVSLVQFPKGDSKSTGKKFEAVFRADGNVAVIP